MILQFTLLCIQWCTLKVRRLQCEARCRYYHGYCTSTCKCQVVEPRDMMTSRHYSDQVSTHCGGDCPPHPCFVQVFRQYLLFSPYSHTKTLFRFCSWWLFVVLLPPDLTSWQCVVQCLRALGNVWTVTLWTQYELIKFIYFQNTKFENQNSIQYCVRPSKNMSVSDLKEIWNNRTNLLTNNYLLTALGERVKN